MIFVSCQTNPARMAQWQRISLVMRRSVVQIRVQAELRQCGRVVKAMDC